METRKNIILWISYDFANSLVSIVFFLYFAQWAVIDRGISDIHFNMTFTISAILLLCTAPLAGVLLDTSMRRIDGLRHSTVLVALFYGLCAFCALRENNAGALLFFTLGLYSYLLSFTFYTPLLNDIASPRKRGLVSGLGISANYLGQFAGLLVALPLASGGRAETLLPSVLLFFLFSLPMLLFFKEPQRASEHVSLRRQFHTLFKETKYLFGFPSTALFLVSYFLFNDAILTTSNNFPIFLEQVWGISDTAKTQIILGVLMMCIIGGTLSGFVADRIGHRKTLLILLAGWIVILPLVGFLTNFTLFVLFTILMGTWFGASWAISRTVMGYLSPKGKHNLAFAYFGLAERASSFIGPIAWGFAVSNLTWMGSDRYRIATLIMTGFVVLGLFVLARVKDDRGAS